MISTATAVTTITAVQDTGYDNSCLYEDEGLNRDGPREFDCPRWVIESTDQIWNMYRDWDTIESYLRLYMVEDWESISGMGEHARQPGPVQPAWRHPAPRGVECAHR